MNDLSQAWDDDIQFFPADPQHHEEVLPNCVWLDGSEFQYDLAPRYVCNGWIDTRTGGIYDVPDLPEISNPFRYSGIGHWLEKWQKDYRFASVSDANARATEFPEVQDPWMFTEYLYEGCGKNSDLSDATGFTLSIIEPPLFYPLAVGREWMWTNEGQPILADSGPLALNDQRPTIIPYQHNNIFRLESKWISEADWFKPGEAPSYWESELEAMGWVEVSADGRYNHKFARLPTTRRVFKYGQPSLNSGVRLYRRPVWTQSTRWGQSQNVPPRIVNMTGPKDWFKPDSMLTGRIIPKVTISWGIPINDEISKAEAETGRQVAIVYKDYPGSSLSIGMWTVTPSGENENPAAVFVYPTFSGIDGSDIIVGPRNSFERTRWPASPPFENNDLIHHGCAFWVGHSGQAYCKYYADHAANFQCLEVDETPGWVDPDADASSIDVANYPPETQDIAVYFVCETNQAPQEVKSLGKKILTTIIDRWVSSISIVNMDGSACYPLHDKAAGGFVDGPGSWAKFLIRHYYKNRPTPVPSLCAMLNGEDGDTRRQAYAAAGGKCAYYTPQGVRVLASYEMDASNGSEWANMQRGLPPGYKKAPYETAGGQTMMAIAGIGPIGGGWAAAYGLTMMTYFAGPDAYTAGLDEMDWSRVSIEWVPETIGVENKRMVEDASLTDDRRDPKYAAANERVVPGTGRHIIDWKDDEPIGGTDSVFFGFINQINYRVMHNVQHCFRRDKCSGYITSPSQQSGWRRGAFSAINFKTHSLRMTGYPAEDHSQEHCLYGNAACPFNNLDRRAVEFDHNYRVLLDEILKPFRRFGINGFAAYGIQEAFLHPSGYVAFLTSSDVAPSGINDENPLLKSMCVAVAPETPGANPDLLGHWQPVIQDQAGNRWRVFFYYDRPSWDGAHTLGHILAHIVQFDDTDQACYLAIPSGYRSHVAQFYGNANTIPWLIELYDNYNQPGGNCMYATNAQSFGGGRNPEYKDRSKIQYMIMSEEGGETPYNPGTTTNQYGGSLGFLKQLKNRWRRSYWIDADGDWILDGRTLGIGEGFVSAQARIHSRVKCVGNRTPIDGMPGMAVDDPTNTNMAYQYNLARQTADYAGTAYAFSNDTKAFLDAMSESETWSSLIGYNANDLNSIWIGPPQPDMRYLPRERVWYQCNVCGLDFSDEEVNSMQATLNHQGQPFWAPPSGYNPPPSGVNVEARMICPRRDGGWLVNKGSWDHFLKCYARGYVDVWAPPGTTVRHDGYFWKNPTLVNAALQNQILRKLGTYHPTGGGYSFEDLTVDLEKMGRLPSSTVRSYDPGLARQIIIPWAVPGDTVFALRTRFQDVFNFTDRDTAYLQRADQTFQPVSDEVNTALALNDVVQFWRYDDNGGLYRVGLPIAATAVAPESITSERIVRNDARRPVRGDHPVGQSGDQAFNEALKQWLLDVVFGSLNQWSSSVYAKVNAYAELLTQRGMSPAFAKPFDPITGTTLENDERVLAPYGQTIRVQTATGLKSLGDTGGMKMITINHLKRLRNRVIPTLAYDLSASNEYTAGGDYTPEGQKDHTHRYDEVKRPLPLAKFGTIPPQILAANDMGFDQYFDWETGDVEGEMARAYYPTGPTWWRLTQTVGAIKRNGGTNFFHLDDSTLLDANNRFHYTGDNVVSSCVYFLHGRLPLDKEILAAYLIYTPGDPPGFEALGCQGQYTGNVGVLNPWGDMGETYYQGHEYCYWQHYHGFTVNHEPHIPRTYSGLDAKNHVERGHPNPPWFGDKRLRQDLPYLLSEDQEKPLVPQGAADAEQEFKYLPFVAGDEETLYLDRIAGIGIQFVDLGYGFSTTQNWVRWTRPGKIERLVNEYAIWKDMDYQTYTGAGGLVERFYVKGLASINTTEAQQSLHYYGGTFRDQIFTREHQPIPGWLDLDSYNSSQRFAANLLVEPQRGLEPLVPTADTLPVDTGSVNGPSNTIEGGGNGSGQAGAVRRIMNITDTIKRLYNERVSRFYSVQLGKKWDELFDYFRNKTDTNLGTCERFHQDMWNPQYFWNYRYMKKDRGVWINDPWHHPALEGEHIKGQEDEEPIKQTQADRDAVVESVTSWDTQGKDAGDPDYKQYHPWSLLDFAPKPFDPDIAEPANIEPPEPGPSPEPYRNSNRYWRTTDISPLSQEFVMDLRQVPLMHTYRPWKDIGPSIDSTNARCPNISCFVHQNGWTVGQFLAAATSSWGGYGVVPSTSSDRCAACGTKMGEADGVVYSLGDGIKSAWYDPAFEENSLISAFEIALDTEDGWLYEAKHGFVVEVFNSKTQQWKPLLTVNYDEYRRQFAWKEWSGTEWTIKRGATLPQAFRGAISTVDMNGSQIPAGGLDDRGKHFVVTTACKVRFKVFKPYRWDRTESPATFTMDTTAQVIRLPAEELIEDASKYAGRKFTLTRYIPQPGGGVQADTLHGKISGVTHLPDGSFEMRITTHMDFTYDTLEIQWCEYVSRCTRFLVYGYPWNSPDVVMTPPGFIQPIMFSKGNSAFRLNAWPTQICSFFMTTGEGQEVAMTQSLDPENNFCWTVTKDKYGDVEYLRIESGQWFYDYKQNAVVLPTNYFDPDTHAECNIWDLNAVLYNNPNSDFSLKTLPNLCMLEYFVGTGVGADVTCSAIGMGPSYQVEAEAVSFVYGEESIEAEFGETREPPPQDSDVQLSSLPDMGYSLPIRRTANEAFRYKLHWKAYNHQPIVWKPAINWLVGDELPHHGWGDINVMNVFTGNHGWNMDRIGPSAAIAGTAQGTVTIYGTPNTLLSGQIWVYAKAMTQRTYHLATGGSDADGAVIPTEVTTYERTGGLKTGCFIFRLQVDEEVSNRRTGITCPVPKVVVYLKERKLTDKPEMT